MTGRLAVVLGAALASFACGHSRAVVFLGSTAEPPVAADQVLETSVMPRDSRWLGRVEARCRPVSVEESFDDQALFDLDCRMSRLRSLLREEAATAGGDVLSEIVCSTGVVLACSALVSRLRVRPSGLESGAPIASGLREVVGNARIAFVPARGAPPHAPRASSLVSDQPNPLPSHESLGCLRVHCESCSEEDAHDALQVAAARLGGSALVSAHCRSNERATECVADVAVNERD